VGCGVGCVSDRPAPVAAAALLLLVELSSWWARPPLAMIETHSPMPWSSVSVEVEDDDEELEEDELEEDDESAALHEDTADVTSEPWFVDDELDLELELESSTVFTDALEVSVSVVSSEPVEDDVPAVTRVC
jgi:hypothetical protein